MSANKGSCNKKCPTGIFDCHCPICECKVCDPDEKEKRKKKPDEIQPEEMKIEITDEKKKCGCGESTRFHCKCTKCGCYICDDPKFQKKMEQLQPCVPPECLHFDKRVVLDDIFDCRCDNCICLACDDPYKTDRPKQEPATDPDPVMYFLKRPYETCGGVCSKMRDGPPPTSCEAKNVCKLVASRSCK